MLPINTLTHQDQFKSPAVPPLPASSLSDPPPSLHKPSPIAEPLFSWGNVDCAVLIDHMNGAYGEVVHWKLNLFLVPFDSVGKRFIAELARLYRSFATSSALECIALKATTVLTALTLQKPYAKSKAKVHVKCLERRMQLYVWSEGRILDLLTEGLNHLAKNLNSLVHLAPIRKELLPGQDHLPSICFRENVSLLSISLKTGVVQQAY